MSDAKKTAPSAGSMGIRISGSSNVRINSADLAGFEKALDVDNSDVAIGKFVATTTPSEIDSALTRLIDAIGQEVDDRVTQAMLRHGAVSLQGDVRDPTFGERYKAFTALLADHVGAYGPAVVLAWEQLKPLFGQG